MVAVMCFEVVALYTAAAAAVPPAHEERNAPSRRITESDVDGQ